MKIIFFSVHQEEIRAQLPRYQGSGMMMGMPVMGNKGMVPMVPGTSSVLMNPMPPMMRQQMGMPAGKNLMLKLFIVHILSPFRHQLMFYCFYNYLILIINNKFKMFKLIIYNRVA